MRGWKKRERTNDLSPREKKREEAGVGDDQWRKNIQLVTSLTKMKLNLTIYNSLGKWMVGNLRYFVDFLWNFMDFSRNFVGFFRLGNCGSISLMTIGFKFNLDSQKLFYTFGLCLENKPCHSRLIFLSAPG